MDQKNLPKIYFECSLRYCLGVLWFLQTHFSEAGGSWKPAHSTVPLQGVFLLCSGCFR